MKKGDRPGYKQLPPQPSDFRRMKKMMADLEAEGYRSDSDVEYHPGDEVDDVDSTGDEEETTEGGDSSFCVLGDGDGRRKKNRARGNTDSSAVSSMASTVSTSATALSVGDWRENKKMGNLPFWVVACSLPEVFDPDLGKFVPVDR